mmetsp:Transcript_8497/g.9639  ORF Transcript_8497/g.9639 Transcript_8497/m.9639 type:complete len:85 (+) Transcript_8497:612-866(+)
MKVSQLDFTKCVFVIDENLSLPDLEYSIERMSLKDCNNTDVYSQEYLFTLLKAMASTSLAFSLRTLHVSRDDVAEDSLRDILDE